MAREIKVFYIYAPEDEKLQKILRTHLAVLRSLGLLEVNKDRPLPGDDAAENIADQFSRADIILPLLSAHFFNSDACMAQMARAVERRRTGACVIPVVLRDCLLRSHLLKGLDCLPHNPALIGEAKPITSWNDRNAAFLSVAKDLCKVIESIQSGEEIQALPDQTDINSSQDIKDTLKRVKSQATPVNRRLPERLIPYLCDRGPQESYLERVIENYFKDENIAGDTRDLRKPLVCIIHGNDEECVGMYRRRLQEFSLRRFLRADPTRFLIRTHFLKLPTEVTDVELCIRDLQKDLAEKLTYDRSASPQAIIEDISKLDAPVLIYSSLDTEIWDKKAPKIVRAFLQFWDRFPKLSPTSKLICCLLVTHNTGNPQFAANKEKARKFLMKAGLSPYDGFKLLVLPELGPVNQQEAINWIHEDIIFQDFCEVHRTEFCNTDEAEDYIRDVIYEAPSDVKPMKVLAPELDLLLDKYKCTR
jgi:hypothetical protein